MCGKVRLAWCRYWPLLLAICALASIRIVSAVNTTAPASYPAPVISDPQDDPDDDISDEVDFPDDPEPQQTSVVLADQTKSPIWIYAIRLLEIFMGVETGDVHKRSTRESETGYPESSHSPGGRGNSGASYSNYYDFLINEGSYKFWAFFQIATAVLLVYSAFAALYYARYTYYTNVDYADYEDYFFRRRSGRSAPTSPAISSSPFLGMHPSTFQRVLSAIEKSSQLKGL